MNWYTEGTTAAVSAGAWSGTGALRVPATGGYADQGFSLLAGNTYTLTVWAKLDGALDLGQIGVIYRDVNGLRLTQYEPSPLSFIQTQWTNKSLTFTVPQGATSGKIFAWKTSGPAAFLVDDALLVYQVNPTPTPSVTPGAGTCQQLLAPAYFYPTTGQWDLMIDAGSGTGIIVLNPNSGVDVKHEWRYDAPLAAARAKGYRIIGYIQTDYGTRAAADVIAEMDRYREWYGVTSFFLDEADTYPESIPLYTQMTDYAHAMGGFVVLNFGFRPHPGYMEVADILIVFEDNINVFNSYWLPDWIKDYPANRFANLIYGVSADQVDEVIARTKAMNIGYVWITDDHINTGSPYNLLPTYWESINQQTAADCGS